MKFINIITTILVITSLFVASGCFYGYDDGGYYDRGPDVVVGGPPVVVVGHDHDHGHDHHDGDHFHR